MIAEAVVAFHGSWIQIYYRNLGRLIARSQLFGVQHWRRAPTRGLPTSSVYATKRSHTKRFQRLSDLQLLHGLQVSS